MICPDFIIMISSAINSTSETICVDRITMRSLPDKWEYYIDRLSCHIASTGKQYHSHAATIYKWAQEDAAKGKAAPKQGIPDYSCKEGESL